MWSRVSGRSAAVPGKGRGPGGLAKFGTQIGERFAVFAPQRVPAGVDSL